MSDDLLKLEGKIEEILPGGEYTVILKNGHKITGHVSGKMRMHYIKILKGDNVEVEISKHDLSKGRIAFRNRSK